MLGWLVSVDGLPSGDAVQGKTFVLDDVGCLVTREKGISGKVHVIENSPQLWISNFNFNVQEGAEVYFSIGKP